MRTHHFVIAAALLATFTAGTSYAILRSVNEREETTAPSNSIESPIPVLSLVIPSPTGSGMIASTGCTQSLNPHEPSSCNVRLVTEDGGDAGWEIENVVFGAWSRDGSSVALEDAEHRVHVARLDEPPTTIPGFYTTPSLSPDGSNLVAFELDPEGDIMDGDVTSQSIILIDLANGKGDIILTDDVYMPFFIDENRIGYGSGGDDHTASLYVFNLNTGESMKLTNRDANPLTLDPMPVAPPILSEDGTLLFTAIDEEGEKVFELSLDNFRLTRRSDISAPSLTDHQVVAN